MTIHGPGTPIYMSEIQAEFGGGNPMYLSNYYAGGPFVPPGATGSYGAIPASGVLYMHYFYGASNILDEDTLVAGRSLIPGLWDYIGYSVPTAIGIGSMSDGIFKPYGLPWTTFAQNNMDGNFYLRFDTPISYAGWERLVINNSRTFYRSQGTTIGGGQPGWYWPMASFGGAVFGDGGTYNLKFYNF